MTTVGLTQPQTPYVCGLKQNEQPYNSGYGTRRHKGLSRVAHPPLLSQPLSLAHPRFRGVVVAVAVAGQLCLACCTWELQALDSR